MPFTISSTHKNLLVEEVLVQANLAITAHNRLRQTVATLETRQRREVWTFIQSTLSHAAMISKFMKPSSRSTVSEARARELKTLLNVDDTSPVFNRNARNNVEHFDERLDRWLEADQQHILECVFQSRNELDFLNKSDLNNKRRFVKRVYLIDEDTFISEGRHGPEDIRLNEIMGEVVRINQNAKNFLKIDNTVTRIYPPI